MKLLLREDMKNLGKAGEVVEVKEGYGRNYLLPRKLALPVTETNARQIESEVKRRALREAARVADYRKLAEIIAATDITLRERVSSEDHLYGSVTAKEIVAQLAEKDIRVDTDQIRIEAPIKTLGVHPVQIELHPEVIAELKVWVVELKDGESASEIPN